METRPDKNDVVILELDKPRTLRLGHKALKRFSALTTCSMADMEAAVQRYDKVAVLAYVMLSEEDPELTPAQVDDLLDLVPIKTICEKCSEAIQAAFADEDVEKPEDGEDPPQAAGTGAEA